VRPAKGFDLVGRFAESITLPAGGMKVVEVEGTRRWWR